MIEKTPNRSRKHLIKCRFCDNFATRRYRKGSWDRLVNHVDKCHPDELDKVDEYVCSARVTVRKLGKLG